MVENGCAIEQLGFAISIGLRRRQLLGAVGQILRQRQQGAFSSRWRGAKRSTVMSFMPSGTQIFITPDEIGKNIALAIFLTH